MDEPNVIVRYMHREYFASLVEPYHLPTMYDDYVVSVSRTETPDQSHENDRNEVRAGNGLSCRPSLRSHERLIWPRLK